MKKLISVVFLLILVFLMTSMMQQQDPIDGAACANKPDSNDGDCTYSTNASGGNTYFCENSFWFHDCVK